MGKGEPYCAVVNDPLRLCCVLTTQVGLDGCGLLVGGSLSLSLAELLDETHWLTLETTLEPPSNTGVDNLHEVLVAHVEQRVQLHSTVGELSEGSCSLLLSGGLGIVVIHCERRSEA